MASLICNLDVDSGKLLICKMDLDCVKALHFETEVCFSFALSFSSGFSFDFIWLHVALSLSLWYSDTISVWDLKFFLCSRLPMISNNTLNVLKSLISMPGQEILQQLAWWKNHHSQLWMLLSKPLPLVEIHQVMPWSNNIVSIVWRIYFSVLFIVFFLIWHLRFIQLFYLCFPQFFWHIALLFFSWWLPLLLLQEKFKAGAGSQNMLWSFTLCRETDTANELAENIKAIMVFTYQITILSFHHFIGPIFN